ncbi:MAG: hypothetical protein CL421_00005 [Acidimicrobiaceae bacterium]|nr:hypothetical protein [Acidimicrobiaceae bacterium]
MNFSLNKIFECYGLHILRYGWSDAYGNIIPPEFADSPINEDDSFDIDTWEQEWEQEWDSFC